MNYCKFTNQNLQTHNGFQWKIGEWKETDGLGYLCSDGWLHCYTHPLLAVFLNKIHADFKNPKLFEIEVGGNTLNDFGLKVGFTKMRLVREISLPKVTDIQRIAFAILCAKEVESDKNWQIWADNWLNGVDRTKEFNFIHAVSNAAYYAVYACMSKSYAAQAVESAARTRYNNHRLLDLISLAEKALTF